MYSRPRSSRRQRRREEKDKREILLNREAGGGERSTAKGSLLIIYAFHVRPRWHQATEIESRCHALSPVVASGAAAAAGWSRVPAGMVACSALACMLPRISSPSLYLWYAVLVMKLRL